MKGGHVKILLVNPPRSPHNAILDHAPPEAQRFIHRKLIGPPLGLLTLAGALHDHDVTLLEMKGEYDLTPNAPPPAVLVREYMEQTQPDIVGVTFIASEYPAGMEILRTVKACAPDTLTVAGGLHATLCPDDFCDACVDVVCTRPAGHIFRELVLAVERGKPLESVAGLLLNREGELRPTAEPINPPNPAAEGFIAPDRSLLKRWISTYVVGKANGPSTYVYTSLGCPYRCSFCSIWPQYDAQYLQRDVESVIDELKTLDDYPVVRFADANTLVNMAFAHRLFDRIEEEGIRKTYIMDIRFDTAARHPELIAKLARGGLKVVIVGFESFRRQELDAYDKQTDPQLIAEAVRVFHANDIMMRGNYVIPPDYDETDFAALAEYAAAHSVALAGYTILTPMPGTPLYTDMRDQIIDRDLAKYNMFNCVTRTRLPLAEFYGQVGELWKIRRGTETI